MRKEFVNLVEQTNDLFLLEAEFHKLILKEGPFTDLGGAVKKGADAVGGAAVKAGKVTDAGFGLRAFQWNPEYAVKAKEFLDKNAQTGQVQKLFWNAFGTSPKILNSLVSSLSLIQDKEARTRGSTLLTLMLLAGGKEKGGVLWSKSAGHLIKSKDESIKAGAQRAMDAVTGDKKKKEAKQASVKNFADKQKAKKQPTAQEPVK